MVDKAYDKNLLAGFIDLNKVSGGIFREEMWIQKRNDSLLSIFR